LPQCVAWMSGWQAVDLWRDGVVHPLRPMAGLALVLHHFRFFLLGGRETVWVVGGGESHKHIPFPDFAQFQVVDSDGFGQLLDEETHVVVMVLFAQVENQRFPPALKGSAPLGVGMRVPGVAGSVSVVTLRYRAGV
jgi:hypothetical protein